MGLYDTRTLVRFVPAVESRPSFLRDRYFPVDGQRSYFHTQEVLIEIKDQDRRLAPIVARNVGSIPMARPGEAMRAYMPPRVAPSRNLTIDDIEKRGFGEALYTDLSPEQRAAQYAMDDIRDLGDAITRREEAIASEVLRTNGCVLKGLGENGEAVEDTIKFYDGDGDNPATVTVETKWSDPKADIFKDLWAMVLDLQRRGLPATDFVCAEDVANAVINNEGVYKQLDNRRMELGFVAPRIEAPGASLICVLNVHGHNINVISYTETYTGDKGDDEFYMPQGSGFMTAPGCGTAYYGAVTQLENDDRHHTYDGPRIPKVVSDRLNDVRTIRVEARPILAPNNVCPAVSGQFIDAV